jgi:hypothetical protein
VRALPHAGVSAKPQVRNLNWRARIADYAGVLADMPAMPLRAETGFALGFLG